MNYSREFEAIMAPLIAADTRSGDATDAMLREAIRAAGWERTMQMVKGYTLKRMETATPETIKAMHDEIQALCGVLWKGIKP